MSSIRKGTLLHNSCKTYHGICMYNLGSLYPTNINKLEMVQRRAARCLYQKYRRNASPSPMINKLCWDTLAERRAKSKAILVYKIQNELIDIPQTFFQPSLAHNRRSQAAFNVPACRSNCWKYSFVATTVKIWNNLPVTVRNSNNIQPFRSSLKGFGDKILLLTCMVVKWK